MKPEPAGAERRHVYCIRGIAYVYAAESRSVRELAACGTLESEPAVLEGFGFDRVHVAVAESPYALAREAASRLLDEQRVAPSSIGLLVCGGTPSAMAFSAASEADAGAAALCTADRFRYPATRLQHELELEHAAVLALDQLACTTLFGAVRVARAMMHSEGIERALCVASEFYPAHAGREALYNCTSDAACAVLIERNGTRNRLVSATNVTKGYYWDVENRRDEIVASYFPTARHVLLRTIADAGWEPDDVDWIIPHNVSMRSWEILCGLVRLPRARLFSHNIARHGHTLAGDNYINYRDALEGGCIRPGQKIVMFSYGFGAQWTGIAVEA